jgi:hypothetical protein
MASKLKDRIRRNRLGMAKTPYNKVINICFSLNLLFTRYEAKISSERVKNTLLLRYYTGLYSGARSVISL